MHFTTISSWALCLWKAIDSYGLDCHSLFERAGLDLHIVEDPNARFPVSRMVKLWRLAVAATKDPCLGLTVAGFWHPTTLSALGYSWMASENLRDALERAHRYCRMITDAGTVTLSECSEGYRFVIQLDRSMSLPNESLDAWMAVILNMCRISYRQEFCPLRIMLQRPEPEPTCSKKFATFFQAPLEYSSSETAFIFDKKELNTPLPSANVELVRSSEKIIVDYLAKFDRTSVMMQVKAKLFEQLPTGKTTEESIAKTLHMSTRTLQRKLKEEGTTYKQLLDDTRRELAAQYIKQSNISISEITYLLGFSEPSNFSRAYKRWMGQSPSEHRA